MPGVWRSLAVLLVTGSLACFSETSPVATSMADQTTGDACALGSASCDCYGNGTCDGDLRCDPGVSKCVPHDCTVGHAGCPCADEACLAGLVCVGGLCIDGSSDGSATSADDGSSATTSPLDDTADTRTSTIGPTTDNGDDSDDATTMAEDCDALVCGDCLACANQSSCAEAFETCSGIDGCQYAVNCLVVCMLESDCFEPCCQGTNGELLQAINGLMNCRADACIAPCTRYELQTCASPI